MAPTNMLSSDSHIVEPPDLWSTRLDREYRGAATADREDLAALLARLTS